MLELGLDETARIVRVSIVGLLSPAQAQTFKTDLTRLSAEARKRFGRFALIADTINAPVQPQEVIVELPTPAGLIMAPQDRWAVTVGSVLARMQAERLLAHPQAKAFLTLEEAESWAALA